MLQSLALADRRAALLLAGAKPRRALHIIGGDFMEIAPAAPIRPFSAGTRLPGRRHDICV
jgi:hypothetical protein